MTDDLTLERNSKGPIMKTRILLALLLVLAACGGEAESTTTTAGEIDATTTTTAPPTTTTTTAPTTTVAETTTTVAVSGGADCVVGTWEFDSQAFMDALLAQFGDDAPGEVSFGGGSYVIELGEDGTMSAVRDGWQFRFETPEGAIVNTIDGTDSGTYAVEGDTMTVTTSESNVSVTVQAEVDGELVDLPFGSVQTFDQDTFTGTGQFECDDDTLTVTFDVPDEGAGDFESFTTVLKRA